MEKAATTLRELDATAGPEPIWRSADATADLVANAIVGYVCSRETERRAKVNVVVVVVVQKHQNDLQTSVAQPKNNFFQKPKIENAFAPKIFTCGKVAPIQLVWFGSE